MRKLEPEKYYGPIEYKLKLANPTMDRVQHLTTQMIFRLEVYPESVYQFVGRQQ